jgi:hypothetical protein
LFNGILKDEPLAGGEHMVGARGAWPSIARIATFVRKLLAVKYL